MTITADSRPSADHTSAGPRPVRAHRGLTLHTRGWQQEAALRMLMNNLDPEVAEHPDDLVVYGGTGRAARSWDAFDAIVRTLIDTTYGERTWTTVGVGANVIEASWEALYDAYRWGLTKRAVPVG